MKPHRACTERSRSIDFHKSAGLSSLRIETDISLSKSEFRPTYYTRR